MKKKLLDQSKLLKVKESSVQKVGKLMQEIQVTMASLTWSGSLLNNICCHFLCVCHHQNNGNNIPLPGDEDAAYTADEADEGGL